MYADCSAADCCALASLRAKCSRHPWNIRKSKAEQEIAIPARPLVQQNCWVVNSQHSYYNVIDFSFTISRITDPSLGEADLNKSKNWL